MPSHRPKSADRRGVLLLLVLVSLTFFLLLGAMLLVLSTRARTASRAFATASNSLMREAVRDRQALDEALMWLLRGSTESGSNSLLGDRYGEQSVTGTATGLSMNFLTGSMTLTSLSPTTPLEFNGRVLTLTGTGTANTGPITSFRIINVSGGTATLAAQPFQALQTGTSFEAVINGRDFDNTGGNEPYDNADANNAFLTAAQVSGSGVTVSKPAFGADGEACTVDNDGDGVADGIWVDDEIIPTQLTAGGSVSFRVSYLVLDLDGRFNVNAHGLPSGATATGVGPADVNGDAEFPNGAWGRLMTATGTITVPAPSPSGTDQWRPTPNLGYAVHGRCGTLLNSPNPYTLRLDLGGPRPGVPSLASETHFSGTSIASLFTCGELERVLRQFDSDASVLSPRLAAILGDDAQKARLLVTTDSWDTTGLIGEAAKNVMSVASSGTLPQDVIEGRRFNINAADADSLHALLTALGVTGTTTRQWVANVIDYRDADTNPTTVPISGTAVTGYETGLGNQGSFRSIAELLQVPQGSKSQVEDVYCPAVLKRSLATDHSLILDAVTVPSPFAAAVAADPWREPGRVNINTSGTAVWEAMLGETAENPQSPAESVGSLLTDATLIFNDVPDSPYTAVQIARANRLANIATTRSNVFAVWITVEISDAGGLEPVKRYRRLFAIVDRSIPVGYLPGVNLNARNTARLIRYLD